MDCRHVGCSRSRYSSNYISSTQEKSDLTEWFDNYNLNKDLAFVGDGSLTIEFPNAKVDVAGFLLLI